jgi:hypothetical protein
MFYDKTVDLRSRSAMQEFLQRHFRYSTGNSLSREQLDRAWEILETDVWDEIRHPIDAFTAANGGAWTIGTNGRSGGYLVLVQQ